jgi:hypothetical protein
MKSCIHIWRQAKGVLYIRYSERRLRSTSIINSRLLHSTAQFEIWWNTPVAFWFEGTQTRPITAPFPICKWKCSSPACADSPTSGLP